MSKRLPPGTHVAVHPGNGHLPEAHWLGVVLLHHDNGVGGLLGLTDVQCTDPRGFLNQRPGHVTTVETKTLRLVAPPATTGPEQPPLWPEGWWVEPCDTAPPPATARRRTHVPRCLRDIETVPIPIDLYPEGASQCPDPT